MRFPSARIIQFARYPVTGRVKTRLKTVLSDEDIFRLHCQLVRDVNEKLHSAEVAPVDVWYGLDGELPERDEFLCSLFARQFRPQIKGDLGKKMCAALNSTLQPEGESEHAVLVGSDCPFIDKATLMESLTTLKRGTDVVLGPAEDGGYYLIGVNRVNVALFEDIPWGSPHVLSETLVRIEKLGWSWQLVKRLPDVDVPRDLAKLATKAAYSWLKNRINC